MGTVLNYLEKYGKYTFQEMPLTEVDSLALCQLSYLKFDDLVPDVRRDGPAVTLESLKEHPEFEKLFGDVRFEKENRALFEGMMQGLRFRHMRLNYYVNVVEEQRETQFSAVTCFLDDGTAYVAFRGTDETIVGWKEDFNMAFLSPVPGQAYSAKYLEAVASRIRGPFFVGGHSKGGNLAVYGGRALSGKSSFRHFGNRPGHRDGGQVGGELMRLRQQGGESGTLCHAGGGF